MKTITLAKLIPLAVALVLASVLSVFAQGGTSQTEPTTTKGAVIKGRAPVNKNLLRVKLPKAQEVTLKNGLHVFLLESHRVPTFSMEMVILSGGLSDPADKRGLASATAAMEPPGTIAVRSPSSWTQLAPQSAPVPACRRSPRTSMPRG
jgi:hypothetical protein